MKPPSGLDHEEFGAPESSASGGATGGPSTSSSSKLEPSRQPVLVKMNSPMDDDKVMVNGPKLHAKEIIEFDMTQSESSSSSEGPDQVDGDPSTSSSVSSEKNMLYML